MLHYEIQFERTAAIGYTVRSDHLDSPKLSLVLLEIKLLQIERTNNLCQKNILVKAGGAGSATTG